VNWFKEYKQKMPDAPNPLYTAATKTYINDLMIVRVPLLTGEGEMFFAKKLNGTELQVVFFRRVGSYDNLSKNFTGYYESINMRNFVYCKIDYKSGNKVHEFKSKPLFSKNETELTKNLSTGVNSCCSAFPEYSGSWIGALIWCLSKHLSVPFKNSLYGGWNCTSPEATNNELQPGDSGGGGIDMDKYFPIVFPPNPFQPGGHQASPPSVWDLFNFTPPGGGLQPGTGGGLQPGTGGSQSGPYDPWGPKDAVKSVELDGKEFAPDGYFQEHYWEKPDYDDNDYINPPQSNPTYNQDGYRKNGQVYTYSEGSVQNYTNDLGGKFAIFIKNRTGQLVLFPGVTITNFGVLQNAGATTSNGGIHADLSFTLADLQHEYGHFLQAQKYGSFIYNSKILPASLWNMIESPSTHIYFWTEVEANQFSIAFFGSKSDIANNPNFPR